MVFTKLISFKRGGLIFRQLELLGTQWRFGYKYSPRHLEHDLRLNCSVTRSIDQIDNKFFDCTIFVLTVQGNQLCLFWAKAFQGYLFMSRSWHSSSRNHFQRLKLWRGVGPRFVPITFPTSSGWAKCYATVVGYFINLKRR